MTLSEEEKNLLEKHTQRHSVDVDEEEILREEEFGDFTYEERKFRFDITSEGGEAEDILKARCDRFWQVFEMLTEGEELESACREVYSSVRKPIEDTQGYDLRSFTDDGYLPEELREDASEMIDEMN